MNLSEDLKFIELEITAKVLGQVTHKELIKMTKEELDNFLEASKHFGKLGDLLIEIGRNEEFGKEIFEVILKHRPEFLEYFKGGNE